MMSFHPIPFVTNRQSGATRKQKKLNREKHFWVLISLYKRPTSSNSYVLLCVNNITEYAYIVF